MKTLRETERQALLVLLGDEDPHVLDLLEHNFVQMGVAGMEFLEAAAQTTDPATQRGARHILHAIREREAHESFGRFCATGGSHLDLETACWLLARTRYPDLDPAPYRARLDQMARELRERLTNRETPRAAIEVCSRHLFRTLGFRGNTQDYYDPDNSYLNRVLDRRLGIPITLSALILFLGRRLGLPLLGVNLPGHFLLKWQSAATHFYVDAFHEGRILEERDCEKLCEQLGHGFSPSYLVLATPRQMLVRMCHNLQAVYAESDPERAAQLVRFISLLARH